MTRNRHRKTRNGGFGGKRRAGRRNGSGTFGKIAALVAMPVLVLGLGGYGLKEYIGIEKIGADYCYARADHAQTAIFLDYSVNKDLSAAQRRDLVTALERAYAELPSNGRVMIFTTARDRSGSLARPVFEQCRPAETAAEQAAIGAPDKTAQNLAHIAKEARAVFFGQIERILAETQDGAKNAQESPLLSQLQAISRYSGFQGRERALVWLSDGVENSEIARFGAVRGDMPPVARFMQRPDYDLIRPEPLDGVGVTALLVESATLPQPGLEFVTHAEMRRWWPEWFRAHGADPVRLERLRPVSGS